MKNGDSPAGGGGQRPIKGCVLTILVLAISIIVSVLGPARAQDNPFPGIWKGQLALEGRQLQITLTFLPDGTYSQQIIDNTSLGTMQGGRYTVDQGLVHLSVEYWEPRQLSHPPGSLFYYRFPQSGTMILQDKIFHGTVMLHRVS